MINTFFKKVYHSIDMRFNTIKNARTDYPIVDRDIVNKEYVDDMTTYDTEKARKYKNPFKQWWMKNVYNLSYKQLFDDLLFPRLLPIYVNPKIKSLNLIIPNCYKNNDKYVLFFDTIESLKCILKFELNESSRVSGTTTTLRIVYPNNNLGVPIYPELLYTSDTTSDAQSTISFDLRLVVGTKIYLEKQYKAAETQLDSYGEESITDDMKIPYLMKEDISEIFYNQMNFGTIWWRYAKTTEEENSFDNGLNDENTYDDLILNGWNPGDTFIHTNADISKIFLLIPVQLENSSNNTQLSFNDANYVLEVREISTDDVVSLESIPKKTLLFNKANPRKYQYVKCNGTEIIKTKYIPCVFDANNFNTTVKFSFRFRLESFFDVNQNNILS